MVILIFIFLVTSVKLFLIHLCFYFSYLNKVEVLIPFWSFEFALLWIAY